MHGRTGFLALLSVALVWASSAAAQVTAAPPSPQDLARAHRIAQSFIDQAQVADLFKDVTIAAAPMIQHRPSGLVCNYGILTQDWANDDVVVFPSGLPRGDDVGCNMHSRDFLVSMDVTRFSPVPGLDEITNAYVKSVMSLHPPARAYTGPSEELAPPANVIFPPFRTVRFVFDDGGGLFSRLSVAVVNGWVIEERVTGPLGEAKFGDLLGSVDMLFAINSVHGGDLIKGP